MATWASYAERLQWAMLRAGKTNQSELARAIGIKPQSIQYLCDPRSGAQGSTHTPALARALGVSGDWLARGEGQPTDIEHVPLHARSPVEDYVVPAPARVDVVGTYRVLDTGEVEASALRSGETDGQVRMPSVSGRARAVRVKGNALAPYVKDGQFLLLQLAGDGVEPEEHVVITFKSGRVVVRELMVLREDSLVVLPVRGGQAEVFDKQEIARLDVILCVLSRRWWQPLQQSAQPSSGPGKRRD